MLLITSTANIKTWERDNGLYGGLSPLARGTRQNGLSSLVRLRFIPAGAGNTRRWHRQTPVLSVYPRWRGEHKICCKTRCKNSGLSPLARGTPPPVRLTPAQRRFIPAGAGNTRASTSSGIMIPVYPRWRGEHYMISNSWVYSDGLSPLARGTHHQWGCIPLARRFIPAGAGNTLNITYY